MSDVTVTLKGGDQWCGWTDMLEVSVGALTLRIDGIQQFGQQVLVSKLAQPNRILTPIPPDQWTQLGLYRRGRCTTIAEQRPVAEFIQVFRDLANRCAFNPMPGPTLRVATGNDKVYVTDDEQSWEIRYTEAGVSCWRSSVGNRMAWPEATIPLSNWGRPVIPVSRVMDVIRKNVDRLADPYAWDERCQMFLGRRER